VTVATTRLAPRNVLASSEPVLPAFLPPLLFEESSVHTAFVNSVRAYRLAAEALSEFRRVGGTDGLDLQFEWAFGALGPDLELPDVP